MSQENIEVLRRGLEAGNRRDVEAMLEVLDPGVEWYAALPVMLGGEAAVYRGHEGVRELFRDIDEVFIDFEIEFFDVRDLGDRLVANGRMRGRGKESGAVTESPYGSVIDFRDGKAICIRAYLDHNEALEAAGLEE
jgi:ketosteroid isomerase-like protein